MFGKIWKNSPRKIISEPKYEVVSWLSLAWYCRQKVSGTAIFGVKLKQALQKFAQLHVTAAFKDGCFALGFIMTSQKKKKRKKKKTGCQSFGLYQREN